ncbi:intermembrane phospholipid transport protein YdbH family protein [Pseudoalteromonas sp. T1lg23B]|uniref:intermembrane phospholipid transport protein YdbH family protein n=1 Tax=Pseudoalteromonas sp. T1lg23B TaxID=2077097 RepID=UPI001F3F3C95|nr:YdbH domain-containing protein [Pseudoalteromonas sp. T1lg23B]
MSCLDWSFDSWRSIHIESLCLTAEAFSVTLQDVSVDRSMINVTQLNARIKNAANGPSEPATFKPLSLTLPNRPLLYIENINIEQSSLLPKFSASLTENQLYDFSLSGDVVADVQVAASEIQASVDLESPLVQGLLPQFVTSLTGSAGIVFTGERAVIKAEPQLAANMPYQSCQLPLQSVGKIQLNAALNTQKVVADASDLTTTVTPLGCDTLLPQNDKLQLNPLMMQPWALTLPAAINFYDGQIETQQVSLHSHDQSSVLTLREVQAQIPHKQFKSELNFTHNSVQLGGISLTGTSSYKAHELYLDTRLVYQSERLPLVEFEHGNSQLDGDVKLVMGPAANTLSWVAKGSIQSASLEHFQVEEGQLEIEGVLGFSDTLNGHAKAKVTTPTLHFTDGQSIHNQLDIQAKLGVDQQLTLDTELSMEKVTHSNTQLSSVVSKFRLRGDLERGEIFSDISGHTAVAQLQLPELTIKDVSIDSKVQQSRGAALEHYIHAPGIEAVLKHQYSPQAHPYQLVVSVEPVTELHPLLAQVAPKLKLAEGALSMQASGDLNLQTADFSVQLKDVSALYDTHYIDDIDTQISGQFSSGKINIASSKVAVGQVRSGVVLSNLSAQLQVKDNVAQLQDLNAQVFDGQIHLDLLKLSAAPQQLQLSAESLDLGLIAQAGRDAGIELNGRVSGIFPVRIENATVSIEQGKLFNTGIGKLKVAQNASVEALKAQQPSLKSVIGVLDDLTIETLSSDVALTSDGWLTLAVQIIGENKAQAQPVNFNYTHQENIFTLFRALRLSDEITQKVEDALTKQEQSP